MQIDLLALQYFERASAWCVRACLRYKGGAEGNRWVRGKRGERREKGGREEILYGVKEGRMDGWLGRWMG